MLLFLDVVVPVEDTGLSRFIGATSITKFSDGRYNIAFLATEYINTLSPNLACAKNN